MLDPQSVDQSQEFLEIESPWWVYLAMDEDIEASTHDSRKFQISGRFDNWYPFRWRKWTNAHFKKTIQHFAQFPKLIREMSLFWNSVFSKSSYKKKIMEPYSGILKSL